MKYAKYMLGVHKSATNIAAYRANLKLTESLCNKLKQLFSVIGFSHIQENQGTFSKSMLLFSVTKQLENRYIEHWKTLLFNDDNKSGLNKLRTYRKLNISDFDNLNLYLVVMIQTYVKYAQQVSISCIV